VKEAVQKMERRFTGEEVARPGPPLLLISKERGSGSHLAA
jgi:hypothetical protein